MWHKKNKCISLNSRIVMPIALRFILTSYLLTNNPPWAWWALMLQLVSNRTENICVFFHKVPSCWKIGSAVNTVLCVNSACVHLPVCTGSFQKEKEEISESSHEEGFWFFSNRKLLNHRWQQRASQKAHVVLAPLR